MNINFALILVVIVLVAGLLALYDLLFLAPKRKRAVAKLEASGAEITDKQYAKIRKPPLLMEYARSFFPILLLVLLLRSFLVEPYRIPSGSLIPTLLVGDLILVNKYDYGLRLPVLESKIVNVGEPKVGDITVFRWPVDPSFNYIKRIVGTPGDHVQYKNKVLTVNGKPAKQTFIRYTTDSGASGQRWKVEERSENLNGVKHHIYIRPGLPSKDFDIIVPAGHYFAMGDNRDDSSDSRYWGFVPERDLVGKAFAIWMSWNSQNYSVRWGRIGKKVV